MTGLAFFAAAACGGGALTPGAGDDPGTGSQTLEVDGDVFASPRISNAAAVDDYDTSFSVRVQKAGVDVTTGSVLVTSSVGEVALLYDAGDGRWRGSQGGYAEVYVLDIVSGDDTAEGIRVDGPDVHVFTAPLAGATVDSLMPLVIEWDRDETAEAARLDTEELDDFDIADTGTYTLPVGSLKNNSGETEQERLDLRRSSRITPAGTIGSSEFRVAIENRIDLIVQPTGL